MSLGVLKQLFDWFLQPKTYSYNEQTMSSTSSPQMLSSPQQFYYDDFYQNSAVQTETKKPQKVNVSTLTDPIPTIPKKFNFPEVLPPPAPRPTFEIKFHAILNDQPILEPLKYDYEYKIPELQTPPDPQLSTNSNQKIINTPNFLTDIKDTKIQETEKTSKQSSISINQHNKPEIEQFSQNPQIFPDFLKSIMKNPPVDVSSNYFVFKSHNDV